MPKSEGRTGRPFTVYLPEGLSERLTASARRNYRTKSAQVIMALEWFLAQDEARANPLAAPPMPPPEEPAAKGRRKGKGRK
jgi:hypothetical protein